MKLMICRYCNRVGLLGMVFGLAFFGLTFGRYVMAGEKQKSPTVTVNVSDTPVNRDGKGKYSTSFAPVVKNVAQSVVQVNVSTRSKKVQMPVQQNPFGGQIPDELFNRFFGGQFGGENQGRMYRTPRQEGLGSGVIISKDGYILTNNHVVDGADDIHVTLNDKREFTAKVIGRDPKTDIAVIKIDAKDLPFITITDSDKVEVGDLCLAIGNPFGIGQTVTMGIVSATGRANVGVGTAYEDFIQTDASINPGNSGGALVDAEGRLIGINTAILSRTGGNQGIGFAVPINLARNVMESLISNGKVVRGFLGVNIQDINPALADQFKLKNSEGAIVTEVQPDSPAEKGGLKSGDVVREFNGKPVTDVRHLQLQVADTAPNATVPVKVLRDGKDQTLKITVAEQPGSDQLAKADAKSDKDNDTLNGVTVGDIDPRAARQMNLPAKVKGALVTDVDQDSPAYDAGLRPGSVILEINHSPVHNAEEAVKLTENAKEKKTLLKVWANGASRYIVVDETKAG